jgi:hypothetical protein
MFLVQAQQESGRNKSKRRYAQSLSASLSSTSNRQSQIREAASLVGAVNLKSTRRYAQSLSASLSAIYNCLTYSEFQ